MCSTSIARIATVLGLLLCTLVVFGIQPVQAAKPTTLSITEASWNGTTLTIKGKGTGGEVIDANNASSPFQDLGSDTPGNNGRYTITNSDAGTDTVCRVHVEQFAGGELKIAEAPRHRMIRHCVLSIHRLAM